MNKIERIEIVERMACNLNETEIVEGAWCCDGESSDISYKWVTKMEDIQQIEQGIHVLEFAEKYAKRNPDMEFRVREKCI